MKGAGLEVSTPPKLEQFARSVVYSGLQSPINGLVQLADQTMGTSLLPHVQLIDRPHEAEFGSADWYVQQAGGALGIAADFIVMHKTFDKVAGGVKAYERLGPIGKSGLTGFVYDGACNPVDNEEKNFWRVRLNQALTGAATFSTLTAGSMALARVGASSALEATLTGRALRQSAVAAALSGVPAGIVNAESSSLLSDRGFASAKEVSQSAYSFVIGGALLGSLHAFKTTAKKASADTQSKSGQIEFAPGREVENVSQARELATVTELDYKAWKNCLKIDNGRSSVIVVPETGRIMHFGLSEGENVFWENPALLGRKSTASAEWQNFGGDKSWPAPQANWPKVTSREWPPPAAYDSKPVRIWKDGQGIAIESEVDPDFGIRMIRRVSLRSDAPIMDVTTTYEKTKGNTLDAGIWTITQLRDPVSIVIPIERGTTFDSQMGGTPPSLVQTPKLLSLTRDTVNAYKIGTKSSSLYWIGKDSILEMNSPRQNSATYPDGNSSTEVYTNPNPLPYVELEMLGPLNKLSIGDSTSHTVSYKLSPRKGIDPIDEVKHLIGEGT